MPLLPNDKPESESSVDDYDPMALYYDLAYQRLTVDLDFYRQIALRARPDPSILDLACGSGRITLPLLRAGFRVTGLDLSAGMLELAQDKLGEESPAVRQRARIVRGDMRQLDEALGEEKFDFVFIGFNSFLHLPAAEDRIACLRAARHHLAQNGLFAISVLNPANSGEFPARGRLDNYGAFRNPEQNRQFSLLVTVTDFPDRQVRRLRHTFYEQMPDGSTTKLDAPLYLHYLYREQLETLLQQVGFRVENVYGSYTLEEFNEQSDKIIFVCRVD